MVVNVHLLERIRYPVSDEADDSPSLKRVSSFPLFPFPKRII